VRDRTQCWLAVGAQIQEGELVTAQAGKLSDREWEVVELLLQGKSNKLIAGSPGISVRTVEFHLKNIYAKFQARSRIELILKLGDAASHLETAKLGYSTVARAEKSAENGDGPISRPWAASSGDSLSEIGTELQMKNLLNTLHVPLGMITALFTGCLWLALFERIGHMPLEAVEPWIPPLLVVLALIGLSVGLAAKRSGSSLRKACLGTLFGTGLGAVAMIPIVGFVVYPLAKLVERLGLIDRPAIPTDVTSALVIVVMLVVWLVLGTTVGITLL